MVVLPETPQIVAVKFAERMRERIEQTAFVSEDSGVRLTASIGVASFPAPDIASVDDLFARADEALYRAKAQGRKRFELFDVSLQKRAVDVLAMERDLRVALQHDQFIPYLQPIQCLENGSVMGYEAMLRWNHPERGLLSPG